MAFFLFIKKSITLPFKQLVKLLPLEVSILAYLFPFIFFFFLSMQINPFQEETDRFFTSPSALSPGKESYGVFNELSKYCFLVGYSLL